MHRFVRETVETDIIPERIKHSIAIENGETARKTYETILQMPSTAAPPKRERKQNHRRRTIIPFEKNLLFRAATNNDVLTIERMHLNRSNVNVTDEFGWSALMMAAYEGHLDVVKVLNRCGANEHLKNAKGDTAQTLAERVKHQTIVTFLKQLSEPICLSSDDESDSDPNATFHCDICQADFSISDHKSHETSTIHRFNSTSTQNGVRHFSIAESNVGFRMLLQQGWDRQSGLGPAKNGTIYPIKTTLRKPRSGLGIPQPTKSKVTHFKPFDQNAVKASRPPRIAKNPIKKQMRIERLQNQRRNRHLRNLLT